MRERDDCVRSRASSGRGGCANPQDRRVWARRRHIREAHNPKVDMVVLVSLSDALNVFTTQSQPGSEKPKHPPLLPAHLVRTPSRRYTRIRCALAAVPQTSVVWGPSSRRTPLDLRGKAAAAGYCRGRVVKSYTPPDPGCANARNGGVASTLG